MGWLAFLFVQLAWGADLPGWVSRPPAADGIYHYYVGRSNEEKSLVKAWRAATQDAYETAIRENFGVATSIQASNYESLDRRQLDKRVDEKSQRVRLERFEQKDSFVDRREGSVDLYVLFRYPIAEIEKERARLASAADMPEKELTEIGENSSSSTTQLRIESVPSGADVFINENRWGVTPLLIKGVLPVGVHELSIRHSQYQDVNEKFVLVAGREKGVRKILQPAQGWIRVESTPSNATISVDGRVVGTDESGSPLLVPAGKELQIKAEHPDCETMIRVVKVAKNEARIVRIGLPMLPDRRPKTRPELSREPFWSEPDWYQNTWIWGLGVEMSEPSAPYPFGQATIGFGLLVERRFFYRFGIRAKLMYDMALDPPSEQENSGGSYSSSSSSSEEGISGTSFAIGLPIYLSGEAAGFYVMPEWGRISRTIPDTYGRQSGTSTKREDHFSYPRKGLTLGYQDLAGHYDIWVTRHIYDWDTKGEHEATLVGVSWSWGMREPR